MAEPFETYAIFVGGNQMVMNFDSYDRQPLVTHTRPADFHVPFLLMLVFSYPFN